MLHKNLVNVLQLSLIMISKHMVVISTFIAIFVSMLKNNWKWWETEYIAAVVEYSPTLYDSPKETLLYNVEQYRLIIIRAAFQNADIIVFPESGLTGIGPPEEKHLMLHYAIEIPEPKDNIIACKNSNYNDSVLNILSCAAKDNYIYVVVNLLEVQNCTGISTKKGLNNCSEDGLLFYNSNIALDRKGAVIARYRKYNLFNENNITTPKNVEYCSFKTDFKVTFGMFICFDIMFAEPSLKLVQNEGITDIIFPHAWLSEIPFLSAWSVQMGWAYAMNVNMLAAGYNWPQKTFGGSGIYAGSKGPLILYKPAEINSKILIASVPKKNKPMFYWIPKWIDSIVKFNIKRKSIKSLIPHISAIDERHTDAMQYLEEDIDTSTLYDMHSNWNTLKNISNSMNTTKFVFTNTGFSCRVKVVWKTEGGEKYNQFKFIAFSQNRNFSTNERHVQVCGLTFYSGRKNMFFANEKAFIYPKISSIGITMKSCFRDDKYSAAFIPITLTNLLDSLDVSYFHFNSRADLRKTKHFCYKNTMKLVKSSNNIYSFVIYRLPSHPV